MNLNKSLSRDIQSIPGQEVRTSSGRKTLEIAGKFFKFFSRRFLPTSSTFRQEPAGNHRKKSRKFSVGILLPFPTIFGAFLQDPAGSGGRNLRPGFILMPKENSYLES